MFSVWLLTGEEEEDEAASSPRPSSSARAVAVALADEAEGLQLHLPASASTSGGVRTSTNHGRFRGRVCRNSENTVQGGGLRHESSAAVSVVDEVEGLQLHLSASSSGYKGVFSIPSGRFQAKFCSNGRHVFLGTFDTAVEDAHEVIPSPTTAPDPSPDPSPDPDPDH